MIEYLKTALKTPISDEEHTRRVVAEMLREIETEGDNKVRHYAETLDGWTGDFVITPDLSLIHI